MATITTNQYLDSAVRTAAETMAINGAEFTIRTDTRWHANKPTGLTGAIGSYTISDTLGGKIIFDATKVRWLAYTGGSGNAPAIGATVSRAGVSGYLLGVWANTASAPITPGSAIPATGFLKFREVTGGTFTAGALTGITATSSGADVTGWIEIAAAQSAKIVVPRLGSHITNGDWFYLGTTSGVAAQTFQVPNMSGGATCSSPGLWIETAPGSNTYEHYPSLPTAYWLTANLSTDIRSKYVEDTLGGVLRIGNASVGFIPSAGRKVRIPNIILRQTTATNYALNVASHATVTSRPTWTTTSAAVLDLRYMYGDWFLFTSSAYSLKTDKSAYMNSCSIANTASIVDMNDTHFSSDTVATTTLTLTSNYYGGLITNCKFPKYAAASNGHAASITTCYDFIFSNCETGVIQYARSTGRGWYLSQCKNIEFNSVKVYCGSVSLNTCQNIKINNLDFTDRLTGVTNATTGVRAIEISTSCDNITVDGITFGYNGVIPNVGPYLAPLYAIQSSNISFANMGTDASPLVCAAAALPQYLYQDGGQNDNVRVSRCFLSGVRTNIVVGSNTSKKLYIENCRGNTGAVLLGSNDMILRSCRVASVSASGAASVYGSVLGTFFSSDTAGQLLFSMNEPTAENSNLFTNTFSTGGGFTSGGKISMPTTNDEVIYETPFSIKGYTSFGSTTTTLTGTNATNMTYQYQLSTNDGSSWSAYKTLNSTNLSAETISPTVGFKLRIKINVITPNVSNALTNIIIHMNTTLTNQRTLYDLPGISVSLSGLVPNTEVRAYVGTDPLTAVEIGSIENSSTSFTFTHNNIGQNGYIVLFALGYSPLTIPITYSSSDTELQIQQIFDRVYNNPS